MISQYIPCFAHQHIHKVVPHSLLSWFTSPISRVYGGYIYLNGIINQLTNRGVPPCMLMTGTALSYLWGPTFALQPSGTTAARPSRRDLLQLLPAVVRRGRKIQGIPKWIPKPPEVSQVSLGFNTPMVIHDDWMIGGGTRGPPKFV